MSKKFLQTIIYSIFCLAIPYDASRAECGTYTVWPWNSSYIGPWFSMNYISCTDKSQKLIRQGYGSNDPLVASDAEVGSHVIIGHMGTSEDWYPYEKIDSGGKVVTCYNIPEKCYVGSPSGLQAKQKHPIQMDPKAKAPEVKTPKVPTKRSKTINTEVE